MSSSIPRSQVWNACLGNLFEHYDTALFGFLSVFLAPLMFPEKEPITALILTYAMIPLGMLARPIGSIVFGYIGDVYGRKQALFLTLAGMSLVSGCIALSPTYSQVGILAPVLFCLGRVLQNFLAAGETMGGAIYLLENAPEKQRDLLSSIYNASNIGGHLLASFGVFVLSQHNIINPGWRFLYLCGCITALFGCIIRRSSQATPVAVKFLQPLVKLKDIFWTHRKPLLFIVISSGFGFASYSVALVLTNGLIPLISTITKTEMMRINTYLLVLDLLALPFFGWVASKISREKLMLSASLGATIFSIPLFLSLEGGSLLGIIGVRIAFVVIGVAFFAPFHAWAGSLIPPAHRYAVLSLGYALGSQALGGPTAALALWCFQKTGMVSSAAWYWMALGLATSISLWLASRSRKKTPYPISVHLILLKGGDLLLQKRKNTGYADDFYGLPAGKIEPNESATQAMIREAYEELGIRLEASWLELTSIIHAKDLGREGVTFFFKALRYEGAIENREPDKCEHLKFFPLKALPEAFVPYMRRGIENTLNKTLFSEFGWHDVSC